MLNKLQAMVADCAAMQHEAALQADDDALRKHIQNTLQRCLPAAIVTGDMLDACFQAVQADLQLHDPMHTGAIHAWAAHYLLTTARDADDPLLRRLHHAAQRLLPKHHVADRDDLRLVTMSALYVPHSLPLGTHTTFINHRLGLKGPPLSCEEIAIRMHKPLVYIHELESAILTILSAKGDCHA